MLTVNVINHPPRSPGEFNGVGATLLLRSFSFAGEQFVAHLTAWIRADENDPVAEIEIRISLPTLLEQTLGEAIEKAKALAVKSLGLEPFGPQQS